MHGNRIGVKRCTESCSLLERDPGPGSAGNAAHTCAGRCDENGCSLGGVRPLIVSQGDGGWTRRWTTKLWDEECDNKKRDAEARRNKTAGGVYHQPTIRARARVCVCVLSVLPNLQCFVYTVVKNMFSV